MVNSACNTLRDVTYVRALLIQGRLGVSEHSVECRNKHQVSKAGGENNLHQEPPPGPLNKPAGLVHPESSMLRLFLQRH